MYLLVGVIQLSKLLSFHHDTAKQWGTTYSALANECDLPRGGVGPTQDAFNIYAVDRRNRTIKIARIGANITFGLDVRDYMSIPYA